MDYTNYREWKQWNVNSFGSCTRSDRVYFDDEIRECKILDFKNLRILEIGFGNGAFARWAKENGAIYKGTEVIPELVACGLSAGFDVADGMMPLSTICQAESLDIAVAFDVFEHLELSDLKEILAAVSLALKNGGRLIARVPSGDSPFSRSIQHGDLTHRLAFGSSAIHQLAGDAGFLVEQVREPVFPLSGQGGLSFVRRSLVMLARRLVYPLIGKLFMGGGSPVLSPNMVFVLKKPRNDA